jgi:hypothetical protein
MRMRERTSLIVIPPSDHTPQLAFSGDATDSSIALISSATPIHRLQDHEGGRGSGLILDTTQGRSRLSY